LTEVGVAVSRAARKPSFSRAVTLCVVPASGFLLSLLGVLLFHLQVPAAHRPPTCSFSSTSSQGLTIDLHGGTVHVADNGTDFIVEPGGTGCDQSLPVSGAGAVPAVTFTVDSAATAASTVILDQTSDATTATDGIFPCIPIQGTIGSGAVGPGTLQIDSDNGENVTIGSSGSISTAARPAASAP
jgi:hypothetical protein